MPKVKSKTVINHLRFNYSDGSSELVSGDAVSIRNRFCDYVRSVVSCYVCGLESVELLDNRMVVYKTYSQKFIQYNFKNL